MVPGRLIFAVFLVFQVADGLITYGAVSIYGSMAEGNPLLRTWINIADAGPALLVAKLVASGCGGILYAAGFIRVLAALTAFYFFAALVPWLRLLSA